MLPSYHRYWLQDTLAIRIFVADRVRLDPSWAMRFDRTPHWRCYLNTEAGAFLDFEDGPYAISPDLLHFIPALSSFSTRAVRPVGHFFMDFHADGMPEAAVRGPFSRPFGLPVDSIPGQLARLAADELSAPGQETHWQEAVRPGRPLIPALLWRLKAILYEGFYLRLSREPADSDAFDVQESPRVAVLLPALRWIELDPTVSFTNAALAAYCHLHEDYFIRLFRDVIGETPARYIRSLRVAEAADRLLATDQSVERIAEETGFTDRAHLTRVFQRRHGCTPAAYRRQRGGPGAS